MQNSLNIQQIQSFITDGFVRIDNAFPTALAVQVRNILWQDLPGNPQDSSTWAGPRSPVEEAIRITLSN